MRNDTTVIARRRSQRPAATARHRGESNPLNGARWKILWIAASAFGFLAMTSMVAKAESHIAPECMAFQKATVGAEYVPGVDVDGKAVVPADLNSPDASTAIPNPMVVPVTVDLAKRIGLSVEGLEMSGNTGFLEIYQDGRTLYNGQDLTRNVQIACGRSAEIPVPAPSFDPDRQTVTQDIEYAPDNKPMPAAPVSTTTGQ